jgi:hypothetical protein
VVDTQAFDHQWFGEMRERSVAEVMRQRCHMERTVPWARSASQPVDPTRMVESGWKRVLEEDFARDI